MERLLKLKTEHKEKYVYSFIGIQEHTKEHVVVAIGKYVKGETVPSRTFTLSFENNKPIKFVHKMFYGFPPKLPITKNDVKNIKKALLAQRDYIANIMNVFVWNLDDETMVVDRTNDEVEKYKDRDPWNEIGHI